MKHKMVQIWSTKQCLLDISRGTESSVFPMDELNEYLKDGWSIHSIHTTGMSSFGMSNETLCMFAVCWLVDLEKSII